MNDRLEIASRILAGFAANPAIFAPNPQCGWSLVNATDEDIVGYALALADTLADGEQITAARKPNDQGEPCGGQRPPVGDPATKDGQ